MDNELIDREFWFELYEYYRSEGIPSQNLIFECITDVEAHDLCEVIRKKEPVSILEIGSFVGLSTCFLAHATSTTCKIVCIDPGFPIKYFSESNLPEHATTTSIDFLSKAAIKFGFAHRLKILKGFASLPPQGSYRQELLEAGIDIDHIPVITQELYDFAPFDMTFIDGDHNTENAFADLKLISKMISIDGVIVMHDIGYVWGKNITDAISKFLKISQSHYQIIDSNLGMISNSVMGVLL